MSATSHSEHKEAAPSILTHRFAKFNPFRDADDEGGEELGEDLTKLSVAGGGRGTFGGDIEERKKLHVSHALRVFLAEHGEIGADDVGGKDDGPPHAASLQAVLARQPTMPQEGPGGPNDRSHPLSAYLISSSHNSYLVGGQLTGKVTADRYTQILASGCRCVEIDAWDGSDIEEPKVTHGMTLVDHISFRSACEAIGKQMDAEIADSRSRGLPAPLPIFVSLENHCSPQGQLRLAAIMKETLGDKLVSSPVHADGTEARLQDLEGRVLVMVEYYASDSAAELKMKEDEDAKDSKATAKDMIKVKIVPELAALGVYAQSYKPDGDAWLQGPLEQPSNPLLNIGEKPLLEIMEKHAEAVCRHNASALTRVYPLGTRVTSSNLNPVPFWGVGAHVAALNCQTFDHAMQLQEALFDGTYGWALKPAYLRKEGGPRPQGHTTLKMEVVGGTDLPLPEGRKDDDDIKPYVTCTLYHPQGGKPEKKKTSGYRRHKLDFLHKHESPPATSPIWHHPETLEWTFEADELVFLRILVKSDDKFARNPVFAATAVRVSYLQPGYVFLRLFNLRGEKTQGTLLVRFTVDHVA
ncbi:unnamed protein product [Parajaminaea phylloscopi]